MERPAELIGATLGMYWFRHINIRSRAVDDSGNWKLLRPVSQSTFRRRRFITIWSQARCPTFRMLGIRQPSGAWCEIQADTSGTHYWVSASIRAATTPERTSEISGRVQGLCWRAPRLRRSCFRMAASKFLDACRHYGEHCVCRLLSQHWRALRRRPELLQEFSFQ